VARGDRIGLLGGTFDPPHVGHLEAAQRCRAQLGLERVLLVVANDPWQKAPVRAVTPAEDRFAMVQAAAEGHPGIEASRIEIDRGGPSFTIDTVEALQGCGELFVIVGADLLPTLFTWERAEDLRRAVTLAVVTRPPDRVPSAPPGWHTVVVGGDGIDVSSSAVRRRLAAGGSVAGLVPDAVIRCIRRRDLYAVGR
jgi:nicotinate-nucleotide adenylyltransferase